MKILLCSSGITNTGIMGGESLGFAVPVRYVKDFIRNREAFAFDKDNPNTGIRYLPPPRKPGQRELTNSQPNKNTNQHQKTTTKKNKRKEH